MIISNKYKFIWFFPIGATASTSLFISLCELYDDADCKVLPWWVEERPDLGPAHPGAGPSGAPIVVHKHMTPSDLLDRGFDSKKFNEYCKIAVCRNPYTWIGSHLRKNNKITTFSNSSIYSAFESVWLKDTNHYDGQAPLLKNIDKIIKFEELPTQFENFKKRFSIKEDVKFRRITKHHEHTPINYINNYTHDGFKYVNERFVEDFELLGYEKLWTP